MGNNRRLIIIATFAVALAVVAALLFGRSASEPADFERPRPEPASLTGQSPEEPGLNREGEAPTNESVQAPLQNTAALPLPDDPGPTYEEINARIRERSRGINYDDLNAQVRKITGPVPTESMALSQSLLDSESNGPLSPAEKNQLAKLLKSLDVFGISEAECRTGFINVTTLSAGPATQATISDWKAKRLEMIKAAENIPASHEGLPEATIIAADAIERRDWPLAISQYEKLLSQLGKFKGEREQLAAILHDSSLKLGGMARVEMGHADSLKVVGGGGAKLLEVTLKSLELAGYSFSWHTDSAQ